MAPTSIKDSSSSTNPSWFTPARLLIMFCIINILNYIDRGAIASNGVNGSMRTCDDKGVCDSGSGIQGDFDLNNFQDGVLSSAFMVGLLVASPIFASLAKSVNPFRLIGVGLSVWTFATAGCGSSIDFWSIAICRMLVGVGEASFISLAAPFIDDNAPPSQKTVWLAAFYMTIPTGIALGYVYGGIVGSSLNWRYAFWIEALLMLPFAVMGFVMKPLQLKGFAPTATAVSVAEDSVQLIVDSEEGINSGGSVKAFKQMLFPSMLGQLSKFSKDLKALLLERVFVVNILGYIAFTFVIGAYSYWGPKVGYSIYHMPDADMMFGGVTVVCGIFGTLAGGLILDRVDATICNAFKLLSGATFFGAIFCFSAFCLKSLNAFIIIFAIGELFIFAAQAPVNYVSLHCVKPSLRPLSMAMSTVSIHIFGDVPSSPLAGVLQDHINNWRVTTLILTAVLFIAAAIWFIGIFLKSKDLFNEEPETEVSSTAAAIREPLLVYQDEEIPDNSRNT